MGAGNSGRYVGTVERSQPYALSGYHVDTPMLEHDKESGTYLADIGYRKNPTAIKIQDAVFHDKIYVQGKVANGQFTYIIDTAGNLIIGRRNGTEEFQTPHPSLIGGKDPVVKMAGTVDIRNGKIHTWDDRSGHLKPNSKSMKFADKVFSCLPREWFTKDFKKGNQ